MPSDSERVTDTGKGAKDILKVVFPSSISSQTILTQTPFWPISWTDSDGLVKVRFNPGYLIDYQNRSGDKIAGNTQRTMRPENMDDIFAVSAGNLFFLSITTSGNDARPNRIIIQQTSGTPSSVEDWHFGSINVESDGYEAGEDSFRIPMAKINPTTGLVEEIVLRENIHYQQFHMENVGYGDGRVLKSIGTSSNEYGTNPSTKFRSIKGTSPIIVTESADEITISHAAESSAPAAPKSAIVRYKDDYIAFWCAEAPVPYFFEVIKSKLKRREEKSIEIDDRFLQSCELELEIWSVYTENPSCKVKAKISEGRVVLKNKSFLHSSGDIKIIIAGIRRGTAHLKYQKYPESVYMSNRRFYNAAHDGSLFKS